MSDKIIEIGSRERTEKLENVLKYGEGDLKDVETLLATLQKEASFSHIENKLKALEEEVNEGDELKDYVLLEGNEKEGSELEGFVFEYFVQEDTDGKVDIVVYFTMEANGQRCSVDITKLPQNDLTKLMKEMNRQLNIKEAYSLVAPDLKKIKAEVMKQKKDKAATTQEQDSGRPARASINFFKDPAGSLKNIGEYVKASVGYFANGLTVAAVFPALMVSLGVGNTETAKKLGENIESGKAWLLNKGEEIYGFFAGLVGKKTEQPIAPSENQLPPRAGPSEVAPPPPPPPEVIEESDREIDEDTLYCGITGNLSKEQVLSRLGIQTRVEQYNPEKRYTRQEFIQLTLPLAKEMSRKYGIPVAIILGQACLESSSRTDGKLPSGLAKNTNNFFGIKKHSFRKGPTGEFTDDAPGEDFRKYVSIEHSFNDHSLFLAKQNRGRYGHLFRLSKSNYQGRAHALKDAGYATSNEYATNLIKIIQENGLDRYDAVL